MKDLPNVSAFEINKKLNNFQERFYGKNEIINKNPNINIKGKINEIFSSVNHVYKSRVRIKTKSDVLEKVIVGKTSDSLLTIAGEKINIKEIIDIEKI